MPTQIALNYGVPSGFISIMEFSQGFIVGYHLNLLMDHIYSRIDVYESKTKTTLFVLVEVFLSGFFMHTIRQFNIKNLKGNVFKIHSWPPPIACGFGLWSSQVSMKKRLHTLATSDVYNVQ